MTDYEAVIKARAAFYAIVDALGQKKASEVFRQVANEPEVQHARK